MKRLIGLLVLLACLLAGAGGVMASIPEMWTDQIQELGVVRRVYFHALHCDDVTGECAWHYFGTDPDKAPPTTDDPVHEYDYVQFPAAFDDLGTEMQPMLFNLASQAGRTREGIANQGVSEMWTDEYEDMGVVRVLRFHLKTYDGDWWYFGSDPAAYPPSSPGTIHEVADVQFPPAFAELGEDAEATIYDLALVAGFKREGID